jgi:DNA repair protein RecN (Recombination protein N)
MLKHLSIRNFILIDSLDLDFTGGFYAITGETGAGKSILLDAIFFCLGGKTDTSVLRHGEDSCSVTLEFDLASSLIPTLHASGIDTSDKVLIVKRQQSASNRKKFFVNDQLVTQRFVEELAPSLLELHGHHGTSELLDTAFHLEILDRYGSLLDARAALAEAFSSWRALAREMTSLHKERDLLEREIEYLAAVIRELTLLAPREGEEEQLGEQRQRLQQAEKHHKLLAELIAALEDPQGSGQLIKARKIIFKQVHDESFASVAAVLDQMILLREEVLGDLHARRGDPKGHSPSLEQVEERLFALKSGARKYHVTVGELPRFLQDAQARLLDLQQKHDSKERVVEACSRAQETYHQRARALSQQRKAIAQDLEGKVAEELRQLRMEGATLRVEFSEREKEQASATGIEKVRFVGCTNPGTPLAPINHIASGGELARYMLALKVVLFDKFAKPTIVFDEVDTGIGGVVAAAVGERLKTLGGVAQVFAITHQPQVAGKASHHICVEKHLSEGSSISTAHVLTTSQRIEELARMISGHTINAAARKAAAGLL